MQIYLAGPIRHSPDPYTWRETVQEVHDQHEFLNPLDWGDHAEEDEPAPQDVVYSDLAKLKCDADAMIAKWEDVKKAGTPMELVYAHEIYNLPVVVVCDDPDDLSPWVKDHADALVTHYDAAIMALESAYNMRNKF